MAGGTLVVSKLRKYLADFRGDVGLEAQYGIFNCLQISKNARNGDMSGEDLTRLDLRRTPLNGVRFSCINKPAIFDGAHISENTFLTQGHKSSVVSAEYNCDSRRILSSSFDGTVKEWDADTGECLLTFAVGPGSVKNVHHGGVTYTTCGERILSCYVKESRTIWKDIGITPETQIIGFSAR